MKKTYIKPHCYVVLVENTIMQGFSTGTTKAGDDSGKTVSNGFVIFDNYSNTKFIKMSIKNIILRRNLK